ncbi:MAG: hypothetical protein WB565_10280 [Acidimicrobiales bacterium]
MDEPLRIPIASLKAMCETLLDRVSSSEGDSVLIEHDYFWSITRDERTEVSLRPESLTIGQVSECWSNLERMLEDPSREITFGLVWLAEILRTIGDEIVV